MKYIVRRPLSWFGPYQLLEPLEKALIKFGMSEDSAWKIIESVGSKIPKRPFEAVYKFRKNLPWNKDIIKIDPWDTWSMDNTLAPIIVKLLKQLKETKHGIPADFVYVGGEEYVPQLCFDFYSKDTRTLFDTHAEMRWNEVLDKMIWSFEELVTRESDSSYDEPYWEDMTDEEIQKDLNDPNSIYNILNVNSSKKKINHQKMEEYYQKLQEGFTLFGKYYTNLWD